MTSEIDKLKHFHIENYSGTNFTDDLNDGEEFLYTTIRIKDDKMANIYNITTNLANYGTRRKSKRINKMVYGCLWC